MCCLPCHAFPVLCPSGLLSQSGSSCQLTPDDHVLTYAASDQIIWWLHFRQIRRQLDTLIFPHKKTLWAEPESKRRPLIGRYIRSLSYQKMVNNWQKMWGFTLTAIIFRQLQSCTGCCKGKQDVLQSLNLWWDPIKFLLPQYPTDRSHVWLFWLSMLCIYRRVPFDHYWPWDSWLEVQHWFQTSWEAL